jgi:hypothetical protein
MAVGEIFIKLAVAFGDDPKVRSLARYGSDAGLARDLYVQMICFCKRLLTDGFVPDEQVGLLVYPLDPEHGKQLAKQLASVGLIKEEAGGWNVLAYLQRNGSRADVERLSEVRAESGRKGGKVSRKPARQSAAQAKGKQGASGALKQNEARDRDRDREDTELPYGSSGADEPRPGNGLTITQRSKRITDVYAEAEPMCKWPAVNSVVIRAIKTGEWSDDEIRDALLRMAEENRSVTIDSLRIELNGLPSAKHRSDGTPPESTGAQRAQQALEAGRRVQAMIDGRTNPA